MENLPEMPCGSPSDAFNDEDVGDFDNEDNEESGKVALSLRTRPSHISARIYKHGLKGISATIWSYRISACSCAHMFHP